MYIEEENGVEKVYQDPSKREQWGFFKDDTYNTDRNATRGQVFRIHNSGLAIQSDILKYMKAHNKTKIWIYVRNYEPENFYAVIDIDDFLKHSTVINYDKRGENITIKYGVQRVCPMNKFTRIYPNQKTLMEDKR